MTAVLGEGEGQGQGQAHAGRIMCAWTIKYLIKGWILGMWVEPWFSAPGNELQTMGLGECEETDPGKDEGRGRGRGGA